MTYQIRPTHSESGRPVRYAMSVSVVGTIDGSGQADLAASEAGYRVALLVPYQSLALLQDSGANSAVALLNGDSLSGTRITDGPHFEEAMGPEYVTLRTVRFTMAGEYLCAGAANVVTSYQQSVSVVGNGGPRRVWRWPINPGMGGIRQQVTPASIVRVTQTGRKVGHLGYPPADAPLINPGFLVNDVQGAVQDSPRPIGPNTWVDWPVRWNYVFELDYVPSFQVVLPQM